ncbi:GGDEF domain-containing protein [Sulfurimonas sp. NWX79]|uniref:GGDEF domain-containing protein n=1 Tax=Sulfurimonas sp. NWX79 TaxID=2925412 RepID=UPI00320479B7
MQTLYAIGEWIHQESERIITQWLYNPNTTKIFKKYNIGHQKFSKKFAVGIVAHLVDVVQERKKMQDCPSMNKFVDFMLQKEIRADEIYSICTILRITVFNHLLDAHPEIRHDCTSILAMLKIFDTNLAGVIKNFSNASYELYINKQKEIDNLKNLAYKDTLTGLNNLRRFEELIEQKLKSLPNNNIKILMLSLKGFSEYSKRHSQQESDNIIQNVAQIIQQEYPLDSARIGSSQFALLSDTLSLETSTKLIDKIDATLTANPDTQHIKSNAALILLHDKDSSESIIERGEILLNTIQKSTQTAIIDEKIFDEKEEKRLEEQNRFLSLMKHYKEDKKTIPVTSYYMEIPLQSSAKIIDITENNITISIRKISAISLQPNDGIYITMPKKPDIKAYVKSIDIEKNYVILEQFQAVETSPLDRRYIHVQLKDPIEILIKSQKTQIPEMLHTVSITTFVVYVHHLYDIDINSELTMQVQLHEKEEEFLGKVDKIIPIDSKFKLIIHLKKTPAVQESLVPFISNRQLQIIQKLQEKISYV